MRQIKFRAWDKKNNLMSEFFWIASMSGLPFWKTAKFGTMGTVVEPINSEFILMQFIGSLDTSGNEVYEGDIIEYGDARKSKYVVEWVDGQFIFRRLQGIAASNKFKVIGNIYENEDLL